MNVLQSEKEYLEEKIQNPFTTDTKCLFNAILIFCLNIKEVLSVILNNNVLRINNFLIFIRYK